MTQAHLTMEMKRQLAGILELACRDIEITDTQFKDAESKYNAVGRWLAESTHVKLSASSIFSQGSIRLGTTVKPLEHDEFDVDLICHLNYSDNPAPSAVRNLVGERLKDNATYEKLLEPLNRGWRINYANEFHLDITPMIDNPNCSNGGGLVPDKELQDWKPSNPDGYAKWFESCAILQPSYLQLINESAAKSADIEPIPEQQQLKGVLRRSIQLMKRHRDLYFQGKTEPVRKCAPISIIITTLATHSYRDQVRLGIHDNDIDLLMAVLKAMPNYIEIQNINSNKTYFVLNPSTTDEENFAEKWNIHPERAEWFYIWHQAAINSLEALIYGGTEGLDTTGKLLTEIVGDFSAKRSLNQYSDVVNAARKKGTLGMTAAGLISTDSGRPIQKNTFFGK